MNALNLLPPGEGPLESGRLSALREQPTPGAGPAAPAGDGGPNHLKRPGDLRGQAPAPSGTPCGGALGTMADLSKIKMETAPDKIVQLEMDRHPGAREAFQKLSPDEQRRFLQLSQSQVAAGTRVPAELPKGGGMGMGFGGLMGGIGAALPAGEQKPAAAGKPAAPPAPMPAFKPPTEAEMKAMMEQGNGTMARTGLYGILSEGKLGTKDSTGSTLLTNLERLNAQQTAPGLDRKQIFRETVQQINDPDSLHQGNKGTCTVATLENLNAAREPAEYARLVGGLASPSGQVRLRNGETLVRDHGLTEQDQSGRSTVSRLYQASMMEYANGELNYDNQADGHYRAAPGPVRNPGGKDSPYVHGGLNAEEWERAVDGVLPGDRRPVHFQGNPANAERDIKGALSRGGPVPVALRWARDEKSKHASHALSVEKMDATHVYLRNPWGYGDNAGPDGPKRETTASPNGKFFGMKMATGMVPLPGMATGGHIRMTREEFYKNLQFYYVPSQGG